MYEQRGVFIDEMLSLALPMLQKVLDMDPTEAVIDVSDEIIGKVDKCMSRCYQDVNEYRHKDLIHEMLLWWRVWRVLKPLLLEGWNLQLARSHAIAGMTYLKTLAQIHEEIRVRLKKENKLSYWPGDSMRVCIHQTMIEMKTNRSAALKKLYQLIKKALLLEREYLKQETVRDFFFYLTRYDYKLAIPFVDVFGYEERELKDISLLCVFARCPAENVRDCIPLLSKFSSEDRIEEGLKTLLANCVDSDIELALLLVKKMPSRSSRNQALVEIARACARKGNFTQAEACAEMITSVVLKNKIDAEIKAFKPDDRPVYTGESSV